MTYDNPVKRLKESLDCINVSFIQLRDSKKSIKLKDVLKQTYDLEAKSFSDILSKWILLKQLNEKARERVISLGNTTELHIKPFQLLSNFFNTSNFDITFDNCVYLFTGETALAIDFCVDLVRRDNDGKEVEIERINDIKKDIEDLLGKIPSYDVDDEIKSFVFNQLTEIHKVLHHYNLYGLDGIEEVLESTMGSVLRRYHRSDVFKESQIKIDLWGILGKLNTLIGLCTSTPILIEELEKFIK